MAQHPATRSRTRGPLSEVALPKREEELYVTRGYSEVRSDDTEWEDEEDLTTRSEDGRSVRQTSPRDGPSVRTTPRRRKTAHTVHGFRKQTTVPPSPKPNPPAGWMTDDDATLLREAMVNGTLNGAVFTGRYALDVFSTAIHLLRKPLSILLFLWLLTFVIGRVSHTFRPAFAPLCVIPGISSLPICRSRDANSSSGKRASKWADYPKLMDVQSKAFEQLMGEMIGGSALSLEIKRAEMAIQDLVVLVRNSDLRARYTLASSLTEFVDDAKKTGQGLQKLTSKVGGAVDSIMAVNDYALHSIEDARASLPSPWSLSSLMPWTPSRQSVDAVVTKTFEEAMDVLSKNMERLITDAEYNRQKLGALDERLNTLYETFHREDNTISSDKTEILEKLWTKVGGNRKTLRRFERNLVLLKGLGTYRRQAREHVIAALQTLRAMSADMEDLRERVAAPDLVGSTVPPEVHMKSIRMGLERLREGRIQAKKLAGDAVRRVLSGNGGDNDEEDFDDFGRM